MVGNLIKRAALAIATVTALALASPAFAQAPRAYVTNQSSNNVSVIDTATNAVTATVTVGSGPIGVAVTGPPPPPPVYEVPTLSEWAMILLVLSLAGMGVVIVRRRQAL